MKTIQLTHGGKQLDLSEQEALWLHSALTEALKKAGSDPGAHHTLKSPGNVQTFQRADENQALTDC